MDQSQINTNNNEQLVDNKIEKTPDEKGGIYLQGHVKIFDPETKEVFMDGRA